MEQKIIEDFLWIDIFKNDILSVTLPVVVMIIVFRIVALLFKKVEKLRACVYMMKALSYGYVVIMLCVYFFRTENSLQTINVFTGFTFLFSAIEIGDNLMLSIEEVCKKTTISDDCEKKLFSKQENDFNSMILLLINLRMSIKPGRIKGTAQKYSCEIIKSYHSMQFWEIDTILEGTKDESSNFSDYVVKIVLSDILTEISNREKEKLNGKKFQKSLILNKKQCDDLIALLDEAIKCREIYYEEKYRLLTEIKKLKLLK